MSSHQIDPSVRQLAEQIGMAMAAELWERLRKSDALIAPEYLSPKQVSQLSGISTKTLEAMRGTRSGPSYCKVGGRVRYRVQDVRDFIEAGRVK